MPPQKKIPKSRLLAEHEFLISLMTRVRWDGWMDATKRLSSFFEHPARIMSCCEDPDETRIVLRCRVILIMPKNSDIAPNPVSRRVRATASLPQLLPLFLRRV